MALHEIRKKGWLEKQGRVNTAWKRRFVAFSEHSLSYSIDEFSAPKGHIDLRGAVVKPAAQTADIVDLLSAKEELCFVIINPARIYVLKAASPKDAEDWIRVIQDYIDITLMDAQRSQEWSMVILSAHITNNVTLYEVLATHLRTKTQCNIKIRYSGLLALHERLVATYSDLMAGINFPPKKVFGNKQQNFVDGRRTALNCYLQALCGVPTLIRSPELRATLKLKEQGMTHESQTWLESLPPENSLPSLPENSLRSGQSHVIVQVNISCQDLPNFGANSPRPMAILYRRENIPKFEMSLQSITSFDSMRTEFGAALPVPSESGWNEIGRSEVELGSSVTFKTPFYFNFLFQEPQELRVVIQHVAGTGQTGPTLAGPSTKDMFGEVSFYAANLLTSSNRTLNLPLIRPGRSSRGFLGSVNVEGHEVPMGNHHVDFRLSCPHLPVANVYLQLYRMRSDRSFTPVHRTEQCRTAHPHWQPFNIPAQLLCAGNPDGLLKIACYGTGGTVGRHESLGELTLSLRDIVSKGCGAVLKLQNNGVPNAAPVTLHLDYIDVLWKPNFLNLIQKGLALPTSFAIDFTASNLPVENPSSLHYCSATVESQYLNSMDAIGPVLDPYTRGTKYHAHGFGGKLPELGSIVSQDFPLTFDWIKPEISTFSDVRACYKDACRKVELYAPTSVTDIISGLIARAKESMKNRVMQFHILTIITDGNLDDEETVVKLLREAAELPLYIIAVGLGSGDFTPLKELTTDEHLKVLGEKPLPRQVLHFVPYRPRQKKELQQGALKAALAEIPKVITDWFESNDVLELPSVHISAPNPAFVPSEPTAAASTHKVGSEDHVPFGVPATANTSVSSSAMVSPIKTHDQAQPSNQVASNLLDEVDPDVINNRHRPSEDTEKKMQPAASYSSTFPNFSLEVNQSLQLPSTMMHEQSVMRHEQEQQEREQEQQERNAEQGSPENDKPQQPPEGVTSENHKDQGDDEQLQFEYEYDQPNQLQEQQSNSQLPQQQQQQLQQPQAAQLLL
eukprot:m.151380 g.151380  ORF g.151380 m.151380 type:complete len:1019 (-) comp24505_c0_seq9:153-3209(-)